MTHAFNQNQRMNNLTVAASGASSVLVTTPASPVVSAVPVGSRGLLLSVATLGLVACGDPPVPANVYVPGPGYQQSLRIWAEVEAGKTVRVGAPVVLHASKRAGPWQLVPKAQANLNDCWWRRPPPEEEAEVASGVTWQVRPRDSVRFNLPKPPDWERRVHFGLPGQYRMWAVAPGCKVPVQSDTIAIDVVGEF